MKKMSAKDISFEKERVEFRKHIRELEQKNKILEHSIRELNCVVQERDAKITELQDWVERLLEYTELSEDEMKKIIQIDKDTVKVSERLKDMEKLLLTHTVFGGFRE